MAHPLLEEAGIGYPRPSRQPGGEFKTCPPATMSEARRSACSGPVSTLMSLTNEAGSVRSIQFLTPRPCPVEPLRRRVFAAALSRRPPRNAVSPREIRRCRLSENRIAEISRPLCRRRCCSSDHGLPRLDANLFLVDRQLLELAPVGRGPRLTAKCTAVEARVRTGAPAVLEACSDFSSLGQRYAP